MCGPRANGRDGSDKYDQFQSIHSRQMQERGLGHLPVTDDFWRQFVEWGCRERWCDVCILMIRMSNETVEQMYRGLAINRHAAPLRIQRVVTGQPIQGRSTHLSGPSTIPSYPGGGGRTRSDSLWRRERSRNSARARSLPRRVTLALGPHRRVLGQELLHPDLGCLQRCAFLPLPDELGVWE